MRAVPFALAKGWISLAKSININRTARRVVGCDVRNGMLLCIDYGNTGRGNKERQRKSARNHPQIQPARAGCGIDTDITCSPLPRSPGVESRQEKACSQTHQTSHRIPKAHQGRQDSRADPPIPASRIDATTFHLSWRRHSHRPLRRGPMQTRRGHAPTKIPRKSAFGPHIISIKKTFRGHVPAIPFERVARYALSASYPRYELSLVLCGDALARKLNKKHRHKTYAANVLSFPLSSLEGEIFLNVGAATREARRFRTSTKKRVALLFVHGLLHLKGLQHGRTMDTREQKILREFDLA